MRTVAMISGVGVLIIGLETQIGQSSYDSECSQMNRPWVVLAPTLFPFLDAQNCVLEYS